MKKTLLSLCAMAAFAAAGAQSFYASTDKFGYTGTVTKYGSLADAQAGQNPISGPHSFQQRDGALYVTNSAPTYDPQDSNYFLTAWYYTTEANTNGFPKDDPNGDRYYSGWGNPNNTTDSFVQLADLDGSTDVTRNGFWTNGSYDTFKVQVTGALADYPNDFARLWNAPAGPGAGEPTTGTFITYTIDITASGLVGAYNPVSGLVESNNHPSNMSGTFYGIFQNLSSTDPGSNGFYVFNLTLNNTSWAFAQGDAALNGNFAPSEFGAAPVPEPATMAALGLGAAALLRRRRRSK